ncbi:MAG: IS701 family transposase [Pseudonocardiaceae bacterium]
MPAHPDFDTRREAHAGGQLTRFCQTLFGSLPRTDQRHWAETYVRGLVAVPGRKSIRRICDQVVGRRADQCLQQFVNQSPWQWGPVRASLAREVAAVLRPRAWVIDEVVFPKNGTSSVAVERQYAHPAGRTLNCQLGLATFLATEEGSCPVNWRLMLPRGWADDHQRRARSYVPEAERCRSRWHYLLESVDEMSAQWDLPAAPVVVDGRAEPTVEPLLRALEARGLPYLVQISPDTPAIEASAERCPSVGELALAAARRSRTTVTFPDAATHRPKQAQVALAPVPIPQPARLVPGQPRQRVRRVVGEWRSGRGRPHALWLTNLNVANPVELLNLGRLRERTRDELDRISGESGLQHFEGRSYRGWHHHVTLASAAHGYRLLCRLREERAREYGQLRPYA